MKPAPPVLRVVKRVVPGWQYAVLLAGNLAARLNKYPLLFRKSHSTPLPEVKMNSEVSRIAELSESGERMIERLRKKAFLPESRKGLLVRYGIAEAARFWGPTLPVRTAKRLRSSRCRISRAA